MRSQPVMPRTRSVLAVVPAVLLACGDRGRHTTTPPVPHDATDAGATTVDGGTPPPVATATTPARPAPHTSSIVGVALDRTGTAAASIDAIGSVRLWRALDGSAPPLALPLHKGARFLGIDFSAVMPERSGQPQGPVLHGAGGSPGRVTGTARVLHGPEEFGQMERGDILVARITTPAWTPLFALAAGVVTDVGGPLSHSSIVAREYGIPAVLGTGVATERLHSGQPITVDGDKGTVTLLTT